VYYAWIVATSSGWFAHKVFCETPEEGEKLVKSRYAELLDIERIRSGAADEKDCGHALYDRACLEARKRNEQLQEVPYGKA